MAFETLLNSKIADTESYARKQNSLFYLRFFSLAKDQKSITWFTGEAICDILREVEELLLQFDSLRGGALPAAPYKF